jgi:C-terminal processing protease CtpA/Prc
MLLHTVSVGIGLEVKQAGGKFIVQFGKDGSPSGACGKFNHGDIIEAIDTQPLTEQTTFAEYEALVLGPDDSPISMLLNRGGQKVAVTCLESSDSCVSYMHRLRSSCDVGPPFPSSSIYALTHVWTLCP